MQRAEGEQAVESEAERERRDRRKAHGLGDGGHERRQPEPPRPRATTPPSARPGARAAGNPARAPRRGERGQRRMAPPTAGSPASECDEAVHLDDGARGRETVNGRSAAMTVNAVPTSTTSARRRGASHRTRARPPRGSRGTDESTTEPEVRPAREHHLIAADEVDQGRRDDRDSAAGDQEGQENVAAEPVIGTG